LCCRVSTIPLDEAYRWDRDVIEAGNATREELPEGERWVIARQDSGSCVYLDDATSRCTIYGRRPVVCRTWGCLSREDATRLSGRAIELGIDPRGTPPWQFVRRRVRGAFDGLRRWAERRFAGASPG
ncbi:MAG: YkgJ family cysteine cluster protein, partial [bacterium]